MTNDERLVERDRIIHTYKLNLDHLSDIAIDSIVDQIISREEKFRNELSENIEWFTPKNGLLKWSKIKENHFRGGHNNDDETSYELELKNNDFNSYARINIDTDNTSFGSYVKSIWLYARITCDKEKSLVLPNWTDIKKPRDGAYTYMKEAIYELIELCKKRCEEELLANGVQFKLDVG